MLQGIHVNTELTCYPKSDTPPSQFIMLFNELVYNKYRDCVHIYTDGSKMDEKTGTAVVFPSNESEDVSLRLPNKTSIFTAESIALLFAIERTEDILPANKFTIFTDSLSCLLALKNLQVKNAYIRRIADKVDRLTNEGITINLCWIPSHVGIPGNELADSAAKTALESETIQPILQPHTDSGQSIRECILAKWQARWDEVNNDLHSVLPTLPYKYSSCLPRREERVLARLHIGHTRITHSYRLDRIERPQCATCEVDLTIGHLIKDCREHEQLRAELFENKSPQEIFDSPHLVIKFIRRINLFYKI